MNTLPRDQRQSGQSRRQLKWTRSAPCLYIEYHSWNRLSNVFLGIEFHASQQGCYFGVERNGQVVQAEFDGQALFYEDAVVFDDSCTALQQMAAEHK